MAKEEYMTQQLTKRKTSKLESSLRNNIEQTQIQKENVSLSLNETIESIIKTATDRNNFKELPEEAAETVLNDASEGLSNATTVANAGLETILGYSEKLLSFSEQLSKNYLDYVNNLYSENLGLMHNLFSCSTYGDMVSLQEKFFSANFNSSAQELLNVSEHAFDFNNQILDEIKQ